MRDVSCLQGIKELVEIKKHSINFLSDKEKLYMQMIDKKVNDYIVEKSNHFLGFNEIGELKLISEKYVYLKPFIFLFNPEKAMPKIYKNRVAFIIWTVWRAWHVLSKGTDFEGAVLAAVKILSTSNTPYSVEIKQKAVENFASIMAASTESGYSVYCGLSDQEILFWEKRIFPYLEGHWEFKYELKS